MYYMGIDAGASTIKLVAVSAQGDMLLTANERHAGDPAACLAGLIDRVVDALLDEDCLGVFVCGSGSPLVRQACERAVVIDEIPALVAGVRSLAPEAASVIQMGSQSSAAVLLGESVPRYATGQDCAAGSGAFLENQMDRLKRDIDDYSRMVEGAASVPRVSGRCAVFAKTDVIHCQQEGVPIQDILLGLCYALARSFNSSVARQVGLKPPVAFVGGVARNAGVVRAFREVLKLGENDLLVDEQFQFAQALGVVREGLAEQTDDDVDDTADGGRPIDLARMLAELRSRAVSVSDDLARLKPLPYAEPAGDGGLGVSFAELHPDATAEHPVPVVVGIDVGSTSTDVVLLDLGGRVIDSQYTRTGGDPCKAVRLALADCGRRLGDRVKVVAAATTGSGRVMTGEYLGADTVCNEITAQARAAFAAYPDATNVFEIGGQDSKFIVLQDGRVADFRMNKICAAGTGSFIEEQAVYLSVDLDNFGKDALDAAAPLDLGERCTVFVESAVRSAISAGADVKDVAAGLCYSVARNYLHRVVEGKPVGSKVVLQGGVAYNLGIIAAFCELCDSEVVISPWFAVSGAVGAALVALENARAEGFPVTRFKGFDLDEAVGDGTPSVGVSNKGDNPGAATPVSTNVAQRDGVLVDNESEVLDNKRFYAKTEELYLRGYDPSIDPTKKTIGIPRCLMIHKLFPMANVFFRELGFNVVLTDATDDATVVSAQSVAPGEVCLPLKLLHGHMERLAQMGIDYIFIPSIQTIKHANSKVAHNYACMYLQSGPQMVAQELHLKERGIELLSPVFRMDFGQPDMAQAMLSVGTQLGCDSRATALAMLSGSQAVSEFTAATEELGDKLLSEISDDERVFVVITRNYGIADPVLNMGVPDLLLERGQHVITLSHLHAHDVDLSEDYPDLYWPFAQHIVSGARLVAQDPRLFAVYLTSHGCGPDSMVSHLFRREMGDKPYLQLEVDEHASAVGVATRVEAFLDAVSQYAVKRKDTRAGGGAGNDVAADPGVSAPLFITELEQDEPCAMPSYGLLGRFVAPWLRAKGHDVRLLNPDGETLSRARSMLMEGEYYSFASMQGQVAEACDAAADGLTMLLPANEGGDADGQFARIAAAEFERAGFGGLRVVALQAELLPIGLNDAEGLFRCLLALDICYMLPSQARDSFLEDFAELLDDGGLNDCALVSLARQVVSDCAPQDRERRGTVVMGLGEWPLVQDGDLVDGLWSKIEAAGYRLLRMPISEQARFLWWDAHASLNARSSSATALPDGSTDKLVGFLEWADSLTAQVGSLMPHCAFDDVAALRARADAEIRSLIGGNGRYRYAKTLQAIQNGYAIVDASSLYENTGIAVRQLVGDSSGRVLHLSFDGSPSASNDERLRSFLYYLR